MNVWFVRCLALSSLLFIGGAFAHADTGHYLVDIGDSTKTTSTTGWNNLTPGLSSISLVDDAGNSTDASLAISPTIQAVNLIGTTASTKYPSSATSDTLYISSTAYFSSPNHYTLTLEGLDEAKTYDLNFYASRASVSDVRTVFFSAGGATTTLDAANNVDATSTLYAVAPNAEGNIGITMSLDLDENTSADNFGYLGVLDVYTEDAEAPTDTSPPEMSSLSADPSDDSAIISWDTDEDATSTLSYGLTSSYGSATTSETLATSHSYTLTGLEAGTTYHYAITLADASGNATTTSDQSFTTDASPGQDPVADAGNDQTITLPTHSVSLSGAGSTDPDGSIASYAWSEVTDMGAYITASTSAETTVTDLSYGTTTLRLTVVDDSGATSTDEVTINVNKSTTASGAKKIVVLGSSTAAGTGASSIDTSWVGLFESYLTALNPDNEVVNLAVGGYTTGSVLPVASGGVEGHNIEAALAESPDAIIVNLPSNDVANNIFASSTMENYATIVSLAEAADVPIWITTSQPRNFSLQATRDVLIAVKNATLSAYPDTSLDFWTRLANSDGTIAAAYSKGDGIHLNDSGHRILYNRVIGSGFIESLETDTAAPVISSVATTTTSSTATITWTTDEVASSRIEYGLTSSLGTTSPEADTSPRTVSHTVLLSNLASCTTYYFRAHSADTESNEAVGGTGTFTTDGCVAEMTADEHESDEVDHEAGDTLNLAADENPISLAIPSGATSVDAVFQVHEFNTEDVLGEIGVPTGFTPVGTNSYQLSALTDLGTTITSFEAPLTITIQYDDDDLPAGLDESSLVIRRYSGGTWHALTDCSVDTSANTVSCTTTNFSFFALFGINSTDAARHSGSSSGSTVYGCKDPEAINTERFVAHRQDLCRYASSVPFTRDLTRGSAGEDVRALQAFLIRKHYLAPGSSTGYFGPLTEAALEQFQKAQGVVPATGYFGPLSRAVFSVQSPESASPMAIEFTRDLTLDDVGEDVRELQRYLNAQGYILAASGPGSAGNETRNFGHLTEAALARFQQAQGIVPAAGYFGPLTRARVSALGT